MTGKIITLPGAEDRFEENTKRHADIEQLQVTLDKISKQVMRIHQEGLELYGLPESYKICTTNILLERERSLTGKISLPAFQAIDYIAGSVYIAFDRVFTQGICPSGSSIDPEQQLTALLYGYLLLEENEASSDFKKKFLGQMYEFRRQALVQLEREYRKLAEDTLYSELFPGMFSYLAQKISCWLPHLGSELNEHYIPKTALVRVK